MKNFAEARVGEHQFPRNMHADQAVVRGSWPGPEWPVLIGALKNDESTDAVALDQVMLRDGESDFALCVPDEDYEIRVFGTGGRLRQTPDLN